MGQRKLDLEPLDDVKLDLEPIEDNVDLSIPENLQVPKPKISSYTSPSPEKSTVGKVWDIANKPLTDYLPEEYRPSSWGSAAEQAMGHPGQAEALTGKGGFKDWMLKRNAQLQGFGAGALKGIGDVTSELTSPINLATAGFASRLGGLPKIAKILRGGEIAGGAAMVGHGGSEVIRPDATPFERAMGVVEMAGGGAATLHTPKGKLAEIAKPKLLDDDAQSLANVEKWQLEKDARDDLQFRTGRPNKRGEVLPIHGPETQFPETPYGPIDNPQARLTEIAARARGKRINAAIPDEVINPNEPIDFIPKPRITAAQAAQNLRQGGGLTGTKNKWTPETWAAQVEAMGPNSDVALGMLEDKFDMPMDPTHRAIADRSLDAMEGAIDRGVKFEVAPESQTPLKWGDDPQRNRQFRQEYQQHIAESQAQGRPPLNPKEFQIFEADDLMDDYDASLRKGPVPAGEPYIGENGEIIGYTTDTNGSTGFVEASDATHPGIGARSVKGMFSNESNPDIRVDVLRGLEPENGRVPAGLQQTGTSEFGSTFGLNDVSGSMVTQRGLEARLESLPVNSPEAATLIDEINNLPHNQLGEAHDWQSDPNKKRNNLGFGNRAQQELAKQPPRPGQGISPQEGSFSVEKAIQEWNDTREIPGFNRMGDPNKIVDSVTGMTEADVVDLIAIRNNQAREAKMPKGGRFTNKMIETFPFLKDEEIDTISGWNEGALGVKTKSGKNFSVGREDITGIAIPMGRDYNTPDGGKNYSSTVMKPERFDTEGNFIPQNQQQGLQKFSQQVMDDGRVHTPELTDAGAPPLPKVYDELNPNINFTKDIDRMQRERISKDNDPRLQPERDAAQKVNQDWEQRARDRNNYEGKFNEPNTAQIPYESLTPEQRAVRDSYETIENHAHEHARKFSEIEETLPEGQLYKEPPELAARYAEEQADLKRRHQLLVDTNQKFAEQVVPDENILKAPRRIDPNIIDVEPLPKRASEFTPDPNSIASRWKAIVDEMDTRGAKDFEYRDIMSTGSKNALKKGQTWRGQVLKYIESDKQSQIKRANEGARESTGARSVDEANDSFDPDTADYNARIAAQDKAIAIAQSPTKSGQMNRSDLMKMTESAVGQANPALVAKFKAEGITEPINLRLNRNSIDNPDSVDIYGDNYGTGGELVLSDAKDYQILAAAKAARIIDIPVKVTGKIRDSMNPEARGPHTRMYDEQGKLIKPQRDTADDRPSKPATADPDSVTIPTGQQSTQVVNELRAKGYKFVGQDKNGDGVFKKSEEPLPVSTNAVPIIRKIKEIEPEKAGFIREIWNAPRSMMSVDLPFITSAGLRQGLPLIGTKAWLQAWGPSMKSYGSKKFYETHSALIKADPLMQRSTRPVLTSAGTPLMKQGRPVLKEMPSILENAGVKLNDLTSFTDREESIRSSLPEKWGTYGKLIASNNRAYSAFINDLRINTFRNFYDAMPDKNDMVALKELGDAVGTFTGRGRLETKIPWTTDPKTGGNRIATMDRHAGAMAEVLFAPRLVASRLQMLNPVNYTMMQPQVRMEYIKAFARTAGAWGTMAGIGHMMGASVSLDPFSADFMKIKIGKLRLDVGAGLQQFLVLGARMASNKFTSSTSGRTFELGQGFGAQTKGDVIQNFISNKFQPWVKAFYDAAFASERRPFNVLDRAIQMAVPMMSGDLMEVGKKEPELLPWLAPLISAGVGSQYYGPNEPYGKSKILAPTLGAFGVDKPEQYDFTLGR